MTARGRQLDFLGSSHAKNVPQMGQKIPRELVVHTIEPVDLMVALVDVEPLCPAFSNPSIVAEAYLLAALLMEQKMVVLEGILVYIQVVSGANYITTASKAVFNTVQVELEAVVQAGLVVVRTTPREALAYSPELILVRLALTNQMGSIH